MKQLLLGAGILMYCAGCVAVIALLVLGAIDIFVP